MTCPSCHYHNEADARFCVQCGQPLETSCPACGSRVRVGMRFCGQCGQRLAQPSDVSQLAEDPGPGPVRPSSLDEKLAQLQGYLPRHLADKILANRGRLQGERKLVTVLFTDVTGYTTLSEQLGEEGALCPHG